MDTFLAALAMSRSSPKLTMVIKPEPMEKDVDWVHGRIIGRLLVVCSDTVPFLRAGHRMRTPRGRADKQSRRLSGTVSQTAVYRTPDHPAAAIPETGMIGVAKLCVKMICGRLSNHHEF